LLEKARNEPAYNLAAIEIDVAGKRLADARERLERLRDLYPRSLPVQQAHADLLLQEGKIRESEAAWDALARSRPKDPDVWYQLAEVRGLAGNTVGLHQARAEFFSLVGDYDPALEQLELAKRRTLGNYQLAARIDARERELREEQRIIKEMLR